MRFNFNQTTCWRMLAAFVLAWLPQGCCTGPRSCKRCEDIPAGAMPAPVGQYSCEWQVAQRQAADPGQNMIYEHEWYRGGAELGPFGQRHVEQLASQLAQSADQVMIESHFDREINRTDEQLNDDRRSAVVAALTDRGVTDAEQRVVVTRARTDGLYGEEAVAIGNDRAGGNSGIGSGNVLGTGGGAYGGASGGGGLGTVLGGGGFF